MTEHNTVFDRGRDIGYFPLVQSSHPFAVWRGLGSALIFGLIAQATKQHHNTLCTAGTPSPDLPSCAQKWQSVSFWIFISFVFP